MTAFAFAMVDRMILTLLVGPLKAAFDLSDTQVGLLHGLAFTSLYVIVGLPMGWLTDRYSRRVIAGMSVAAWSLMTALCGLAGSYAQLFLARMGVGIGEAGISPAANSMIPDYFPPSRVSLPITLYSIGGSAGAGLALIFGGAIVDYVSGLGQVRLPLVGTINGWQATFLVAGLPGLLVAAAFAFVKEPPRFGRRVAEDAAAPTFGATVASLKRKRAFLIPHFCASALCALIVLSTVAWMPSHLVRSYAYTPGQAGRSFGLAVLVGGVVGLIAAGWMADRLGKAGRRDASIIVALGCTLLGFVPAVAAPIVPHDGLALLLAGVTVFGYSSAVALAPAAFPVVVANEMRGQVYSLYLLTISVLGYAVGPVLVALLTDTVFQDDAMVGWSMSIVSLIAGPVAVMAWLTSRRRFAEHVGN